MNNDLKDTLQQIKNEERIENNSFEENKTNERTYADCLNFMANINIILSIIGAIAIWCDFSTVEVKGKYSYVLEQYTTTTEINWYGILGGIGVLIAGFTIFFLLKTIVDIYYEVEK